MRALPYPRILPEDSPHRPPLSREPARQGARARPSGLTQTSGWDSEAVSGRLRIRDNADAATYAFRSPVRAGCQDGGVEVLSSRILLRPADLGESHHFYRDVLGLAIYREFGSPADPGVVFFLGPGLLEVSGHPAGAAGRSVMIWLQVRDVHAEHERLAAASVRILREPAVEPWGLTEMWIEDPDGVRIVLVEVPADHPIRRDPRLLPPTDISLS
jgi:catechol 2,3-dioxygenase-like lactoylglutathione lyase family enzyme